MKNLLSFNTFLFVIAIGVVYFDQQMGAPHAVCWSKSFDSALKQVFCLFPSLMEKKERKKKRKCKNNTKNMHKRVNV